MSEGSWEYAGKTGEWKTTGDKVAVKMFFCGQSAGIMLSLRDYKPTMASK